MLRFCKKEDGAALIEMAILLPFLGLLIFGVFEVGNLLYQYQLVQSGVRDAGRYLARVSDPATSTTICAPVVLAAHESNAADIAVMGTIGGTTKRVSWWNKADVTFTYPTIANARNATTGLSPYRGPNPIRIVQINTTPSYSGIGMLTFLGFPSPLTFTLTHQERCIGSG